MEQKKLIINRQLMDITLSRLCHQLLENHNQFDKTVLLGLQPRGIFLAKRIQAKLEQILHQDIKLGYLDTTFHRDDFRRRSTPIKANATHVPFLIEDQRVLLIDDVLYTGRTIRAALDAMITFGRPRTVELLVLINRKYTRHLPIEPDYVGKAVNTIDSQRVLVEWQEQGLDDSVWLTTKQES